MYLFLKWRNIDLLHSSYNLFYSELEFAFTGTLRNVQCGLHIGDADDLDNFVGEIDEVRQISTYSGNKYRTIFSSAKFKNKKV